MRLFDARRALRIADVAAEPLRLAAPVHVLVGLPDVGPAAGEAEGLEAHGLERDVAGEDHEVGPGDLAAVLLLDRPEQAARLVEADVVRPAVERREALLAAARAAAAVADAIGAGAVPGHADEEAAVVAEVGRPPLLRVGHQRVQVLLDGREVEALEGFGVVEVRAHRVGLASNAGAAGRAGASRATNRGWWCRRRRSDGRGTWLRCSWKMSPWQIARKHEFRPSSGSWPARGINRADREKLATRCSFCQWPAESFRFANRVRRQCLVEVIASATAR